MLTKGLTLLLVALNYLPSISGLVNYEKNIDEIIWIETGSNLKSLSCPHSPGVMFNWKIKNYKEYELLHNKKFEFNSEKSMLKLTQPLTMKDSGVYECSAVGGYKTVHRRYLINVRYANSRLFCSKSLCFSDPSMLNQNSQTVVFKTGQFIQLDCSAFSPTNEKIFFSWSYESRPIDSAHSSSLVLDSVKPENEGTYTCDIKNNAYNNLSYSFRLISKKVINEDPVIKSKLEDLILSSNMSMRIPGEIECDCETPKIQWLKRIEEGESIVNAITIPKARKSEQDELYHLLDISNSAESLIRVEGSIMEDNSHYPPFKRVFRSHLRFIGPLKQNVHGGKYALLTVNPDSPNPIVKYVTFKVSVNKDEEHIEDTNAIYYFLIPFSILFLVIGFCIYCIFNRNKKALTPFDPHSQWMNNGGLQSDTNYLKSQNSTQCTTFQSSILSPYQLLK